MSGSANVFLSEFRVPRSCVKCRALIFSFRKCHFNGVALRYNSVHSSNKILSQGLYQQEMTVLSTRTGFFLLLCWKVGDWQGEVWRQERWEHRGERVPMTTQKHLPWFTVPFLLQSTALPTLPHKRFCYILYTLKVPFPWLSVGESRNPKVISSFYINILLNSRNYKEERSKYFHMLSYASTCSVPRVKVPRNCKSKFWGVKLHSLHLSPMLREDAFHTHSLYTSTF